MEPGAASLLCHLHGKRLGAIEQLYSRYDGRLFTSDGEVTLHFTSGTSLRMAGSPAGHGIRLAQAPWNEEMGSPAGTREISLGEAGELVYTCVSECEPWSFYVGKRLEGVIRLVDWAAPIEVGYLFRFEGGRQFSVWDRWDEVWLCEGVPDEVVLRDLWDGDAQSPPRANQGRPDTGSMDE